MVCENINVTNLEILGEIISEGVFWKMLLAAPLVCFMFAVTDLKGELWPPR